MIYESSEAFDKARDEMWTHVMEQGTRMAGLEIKSEKRQAQGTTQQAPSQVPALCVAQDQG